MAERLYIRNRRKRERIKKKIRLVSKLLLILLGCVLLLWLVGRTVEKLVMPAAPKEDYVTLQEAGNLVWLLADTARSQSGNAKEEGQESAGSADEAIGRELKERPEAILEVLKKMDAAQGEGYLTFSQAQQLLALMPECRGGFEGRDYKKGDKVRLADWYAWFDEARKVYDRQGEIRDVVITILGTGESVKTNEGAALSSQQLAAADGIWTFFAERFTEEEMRYRPLTAVSREDELYAVRSPGEEIGCTLSNVWIIEADKEGVYCFWNDCEIFLTAVSEAVAAEAGRREIIADLTFENSCLKEIEWKEEKISGRLLRIADGGAEIEGQGFFPFSQDLKIYRLYGRMKRLYTSDLCVGYAFTDFIVQDGVIEAALVPKEEKLEDIRVLVKTSGFGSAYHDSLTLKADCDCTVVTGAYGNTEEKRLPAGEELTVTKDSEYFAESDRLWIKPDILTGHISLLNVDRAQGIPSYRGSFELMSTRDGIVAINELLLEEYLYAVVPSEMPASYPLEALKSQAVCARTYAYARMCHAGLAAFGAHVDDSAAFQVYNNILENAESTRAVKETKGQVLVFGDELAETYYYSTSCGYGTYAGVWLNGSAEKYPYLTAQKIGGEDFFYEQEEPWFRWRYEVEALDPDVLNAAILKRYEANAEGVLTRQKDGTYRSQRPPHTGGVREISVVRYGPGGVAEELEIEGEEAAVLIKTEYNIRSVLCDGNTQVLRQDGSMANASSMVPSAFFTIETLKEDGFVVGYNLSGGGFGHGVGMSQNGAGNMAAAGMDAEEILNFFYRECRIEDIYQD